MPCEAGPPGAGEGRKAEARPGCDSSNPCTEQHGVTSKVPLKVSECSTVMKKKCCSWSLLVLLCHIWEESLRLPALLTGNRGSVLDRMRRLQMHKQKGARRDGCSLKETKRRTQTLILLTCFLLPLFQFNSVQLLSRVRLFVTPWTTTHQASLSITNSRSLPRLMSIEPVMPSNHLILCHPLLLPSIFPSIRVFSNESVLHIRWPKYWSLIFNINPSNEHSGLLSFRMD